MPVIHARIVMSAEDVPAYLALTEPLVLETHREPGCNMFLFVADPTAAGVLWAIEDWETEQDMLRHQAAAHTAAFLAASSAIEVSDMTIKKFDDATVSLMELSPAAGQ